MHFCVFACMLVVHSSLLRDPVQGRDDINLCSVSRYHLPVNVCLFYFYRYILCGAALRLWWANVLFSSQVFPGEVPFHLFMIPRNPLGMAGGSFTVEAKFKQNSSFETGWLKPLQESLELREMDSRENDLWLWSRGPIYVGLRKPIKVRLLNWAPGQSSVFLIVGGTDIPSSLHLFHLNPECRY